MQPLDMPAGVDVSFSIMEQAKMNPHEIRRIAVAAEIDPKTVTRWFQGLPVRALNRGRIVKALKKLNQQREGKTA